METPSNEPTIIDFKSQVTKRLRAEKRWAEAEPIRDRLMSEARASGLAKNDAQQTTYQKLHDLFPPIVQPAEPAANQTPETNDSQTANQTPDDSQKTDGTKEGDAAIQTDGRDDNDDSGVAEPPTRPRSGDGTVRGLGDLPDHWPPLPPNASLSVEVQWVLANRIRVIRESQDGIVVDLRKAITPAPSYATLGWLETSIRAFAKFVDVSTKASANSQDDADKVKRERLAIEEIRELLGQMRALTASK